MQIEALYTYPIKALRAQSLDAATLTKHGFAYERRFMLLEEKTDPDTKAITYRNMHVGHDPRGTLFFPTLQPPSTPEAKDGSITVSFKPPKASFEQEQTLTIPLEPDTADLEQIEITMHTSPTKAYRMPPKYTDFFTTTFAYPVVLAYLGSNSRAVLMSTPSNPSPTTITNQPTSTSWFSSLTNTAASFFPSSLSPQSQTQSENKNENKNQITFSDCAPYLLVSLTSLQPLSARLPEGSEADITKFRPNIVVSGAPEPWDEDFWAEVAIHPTTNNTTTSTSTSSTSPSTAASTSPGSQGSPITLLCAHNCARCKSLNIDYATGAPGAGGEGKLLSVMQRDRRVDPGMKWSPVFGRYCFLRDGGGEGSVVRVGDQVGVVRRGEGRTVFDWKGLATGTT